MNNKSVYIIAEAGVNHNGNFENAKKMVLAAANCGVNAIKFQTFKTDNLVTDDAEKAMYQKKATKNSESQFDMLKKLELTYDDFEKLDAYATSLGIDFLSTGFDNDSVLFLAKLRMPYFKIPSGEITNYPYLVLVARQRKPIILSTGMSTLEEIATAINILETNGANNISLLHCNTEYPTPWQDVNLLAIQTMKSKFNRVVGFSDHTVGVEASIAAVALGAEIIEKHFTLNKLSEGPDHQSSMDTDELELLVRSIRNIELCLGDGRKIPTTSEAKNIVAARRSIVASKYIEDGEVFTEKNITTKRPADGLSPMLWNEVVGKKAKHSFEKNQRIEL